MRVLIVVSILAFVMFAGCSSIPDDSQTQAAACPTDSIKRTAYAAAQDYIDDEIMGGKVAASMSLIGTLEGEIDDVLLKIDPARDAFYIRSNEGTLTVVGHENTIVEDDLEIYSRNYKPNFLQEWLEMISEEDDAELSFIDELTVDDYTASCTTLGGKDVIEFSYSGNGVEETKTAEADWPYRPLTGRTVDPALQDNYRLSMSYDVPMISIDRTLTKFPITWGLEADNAFTNVRGGLYIDATFTDDTEWAPLGEFEFHLVDTDGTVYVSDVLDDGAWDMGDGDYFEFRDKDKNDMLSPGDEMIMDVGPGLDIQFYDTWADEYTVTL